MAESSENIEALAVALESESLQALYSAWLTQRRSHARALAEFERQRKELAERSDLVLKAVEVARSLPGSVTPKKKSKRGSLPAKSDALAAFHLQAEAEIEAARSELSRQIKQARRRSNIVDTQVREALLSRAAQHAAIHKPRLKLTVHSFGKDQSLLEVGALGEQDAVLLLFVLAQKLPTRWDFFADDSVDDLARGPSHFYPDEGNAVFFPDDADAEDAILHASGRFIPTRMQIPFAIPGREFPRFKIVHHGLTAQIEARHKGEPYAHLMRREDGELAAGYFLRLRVEGKIELGLAGR